MSASFSGEERGPNGQPTIEQVFIHCDPTIAFDLLADVRNETRWNKGVSVAELRSDDPIREGSRFLTVYRGLKNHITLAEFDRPERLVVAGSSNSMDIDTTYVHVLGGGRGHETRRLDRPKAEGLTSVLSPLLRLMMRRELAKKYATVKLAIESQSEPSSG